MTDVVDFLTNAAWIALIWGVFLEPHNALPALILLFAAYAASYPSTGSSL